ncbi:MAG TPA: MBOAT family O-acyltransferase [Urbifossiella sp.]|nr:MBOAT family O-acyltransferase [Urbifossiella sp.]
MNICSLEAITTIAVAALAFQLLPGAGLRRLGLVLLNGAFLWWVVPSADALVVLGLFVVATYALVRGVAVWTSAAFVAAAITLVSVAFSALKEYSVYVTLSLAAASLVATALAVRPARPGLGGFLLGLVAAGCVALVLPRLHVSGYVRGALAQVPGYVHALVERVAAAPHWLSHGPPADPGRPPDPLALIGLSYMFFKFIHVLVDRWQGQLEKVPFVTYANYQLGLFTLIAGPIQRFGDFQRFWDTMEPAAPHPADTVRGWSRLLGGVLKMGVLAPLVLTRFTAAGAGLAAGPANPFPDFAVVYYGYPIYLFLNFSGYTDIAIGCGRLVGLTLPENFNYPFLGRNVTDFWDRWHMSLTSWIRDYVFMTSYKAAVERYPARARLIGYGLVFLSLFVAGIWHGADKRYMAYGVVFGLGAVASHVYGDVLKAGLGRARFKAYQQNALARCAAVLLTFHFTCFAMLFFSSGVAPALAILGQVGARAWAWSPAVDPRAALYVLVPLAVLGLCALGQRRAFVAALGDRWRGRADSNALVLYGRVVCATVFLALFYIISSSSLKTHVEAPVVVYMRF